MWAGHAHMAGIYTWFLKEPSPGWLPSAGFFSCPGKPFAASTFCLPGETFQACLSKQVPTQGENNKMLAQAWTHQTVIMHAHLTNWIPPVLMWNLEVNMCVWKRQRERKEVYLHSFFFSFESKDPVGYFFACITPPLPPKSHHLPDP